jgi:hypothetical protein
VGLGFALRGLRLEWAFERWAGRGGPGVFENQLRGLSWHCVGAFIFFCIN